MDDVKYETRSGKDLRVVMVPPQDIFSIFKVMKMHDDMYPDLEISFDIPIEMHSFSDMLRTLPDSIQTDLLSEMSDWTLEKVSESGSSPKYDEGPRYVQNSFDLW